MRDDVVCQCRAEACCDVGGSVEAVESVDVAGPCDDRGCVFTGRHSYAPQKKSVLATNNGGDGSLD